MRITKFWVLIGLLAVVLVNCGFSLFSCKQDEYYIRPESANMTPGQTKTFTVYYKTSSEPIGESSVDEFWWQVSGPAGSEAKRVDNSSAKWTAPSAPGQYVLTARTVHKNFEAQRTITVEATAAGQPQEQSAERPAAKPAGPPVKIFEVGNVYGVKAGGKAPSFTLAKPATVTQIMDYHYIEGGGPAPGTIGLRGADGTTYGPWQAKGLDAQGGVKNGIWVAEMSQHLVAGTYTVVDADPGTWSTNSRAKGLGFSTVLGSYDE